VVDAVRAAGVENLGLETERLEHHGAGAATVTPGA